MQPTSGRFHKKLEIINEYRKYTVLLLSKQEKVWQSRFYNVF